MTLSAHLSRQEHTRGHGPGSVPHPRVYFGGDEKLNAQWLAGRRFIEAIGKAVWTQQPTQKKQAA